MFKKIILASAILAATVGVAEAAMPAPYVGASIGIANNSLNLSSNGNSATVGTYRGVPFNVFAGYGGVLSSNFYLAGELNVTVGTADITNNNGLKSSYGYGVSLIPGFMVNDNTLVFGRVGAVRSHFNRLISENYNGGEFGLGLQTAVTQNLDIRGEYDFVAYQSNKRVGVTIAPRQDLVTFGLVYKIS